MPAMGSFRLAHVSTRAVAAAAGWFPEVDVYPKDNRLIAKIDLPGMEKEHFKVKVTGGNLAISGERKSEAEEEKENFYRCEREFGSFYRVVPLPEGGKNEDVKATFADGVLEVSVPLPVKAEAKPQKVEIQEPAAAAKPAALSRHCQHTTGAWPRRRLVDEAFLLLLVGCCGGGGRRLSGSHVDADGRDLVFRRAGARVAVGPVTRFSSRRGVWKVANSWSGAPSG